MKKLVLSFAIFCAGLSLKAQQVPPYFIFSDDNVGNYFLQWGNGDSVPFRSIMVFHATELKTVISIVASGQLDFQADSFKFLNTAGTDSFNLTFDKFDKLRMLGTVLDSQKVANFAYAYAHINDHLNQGYLKFSDTTVLATKNFTVSFIGTQDFITGTEANSLYKSISYTPSWNEITSKPTFFSGDYNDLVNRPTLFDGDYGSLTNKPNLFSGAYADLTGKPALFSGSYTDLTNKPKVPVTYSGTTNSSGIYTVTFPQAYSVAPNIQAKLIGTTINRELLVSVTTTGFTCTVVEHDIDTILGIVIIRNSTVNINGANVDVLITEK